MQEGRQRIAASDCRISLIVKSCVRKHNSFIPIGLVQQEKAHDRISANYCLYLNVSEFLVVAVDSKLRQVTQFFGRSKASTTSPTLFVMITSK